MAIVTNDSRPWFRDKLAHVLRSLTSYTAGTISGSYTQSEVQAIADKLEEVVTLLRSGGEA